MPRYPQRSLFRWIAIVAILLNALMPSVSQALAWQAHSSSAGQARWTELCGAQGSTWVLLDAQGQVLAQSAQRPADAPAAGHGEHCPYCLTHAGSFALPAVTPPVWPASASPAELAGREAGAPRPQVLWLAPAARAPPAPTPAH